MVGELVGILVGSFVGIVVGAILDNSVCGRVGLVIWDGVSGIVDVHVGA